VQGLPREHRHAIIRRSPQSITIPATIPGGRSVMRAIIRTLINLGFIVAILALCGWLSTTGAYHHAPRDVRIGMFAAVVVVAFIADSLILHAIPSKAQMAKRKKRHVRPFGTVNGGIVVSSRAKRR
jgi:hypothetical protein